MLDFTGLQNLQGGRQNAGTIPPGPMYQGNPPAPGSGQKQQPNRQAGADPSGSGRPPAGELTEFQKATARMNEVYSAHREAEIKTEAMQMEILNGLLKGEPLAILLDKACKALAAVMGNTVFAQSVESSLRNLYAGVYQDEGALDLDRSAVESRLEKLREAVGHATDKEARNRIQMAIQKHEERIRQLDQQQNQKKKRS